MYYIISFANFLMAFAAILGLIIVVNTALELVCEFIAYIYSYLKEIV